jgi:hypothetical protein
MGVRSSRGAILGSHRVVGHLARGQDLSKGEKIAHPILERLEFLGWVPTPVDG